MWKSDISLNYMVRRSSRDFNFRSQGCINKFGASSSTEQRHQGDFKASEASGIIAFGWIIRLAVCTRE